MSDEVKQTLREQAIEACEDAPFIDDIPPLGTTQQSARIEHYAGGRGAVSGRGKRPQHDLRQRLRAAFLKGTGTAIRPHEVKEAYEALLAYREAKRPLATPTPADVAGDARLARLLEGYAKRFDTLHRDIADDFRKAAVRLHAKQAAEAREKGLREAALEEAAKVADEVARKAAAQVDSYDSYYGGPELPGRKAEAQRAGSAREVAAAIRALANEPAGEGR